MRVYLVKHNHGHGNCYYNSFVVVAANEADARTTHPSGDNSQWDTQDWLLLTECHELTVEEVAIANDDQVPGVLLAAHY